MVLMVVCWHYGMPYDTNDCISIIMNIDWIKWMYLCINEFEVGVNDSTLVHDAEWVTKRQQANVENTCMLIPVSNWRTLITSLYRGDRCKWSMSKRESSVCPDLLWNKRELTFYCMC